MLQNFIFTKMIHLLRKLVTNIQWGFDWFRILLLHFKMSFSYKRSILYQKRKLIQIYRVFVTMFICKLFEANVASLEFQISIVWNESTNESSKNIFLNTRDSYFRTKLLHAYLLSDVSRYAVARFTTVFENLKTLYDNNEVNLVTHNHWRKSSKKISLFVSRNK